MRRMQCLAVVFVFSLGIRVHADQVVLKNGDRLTGTITKSDGKTLVIKTDLAGEITIQWPGVQEINSTQPLHVATSDGKTVVGPVTTSDGNFSVTTAASGPVTVPKEQVTALRSDAEEAAYEKTLHPTLYQGWVLGATVGFSLTRGNSETKNLALAFTGDRKTGHDEITMYANSVYATNDAPGATPAVSANLIQGGARYSRNLTKRLFAFGSGDFQSDASQALDLRSIFGGGLGFHLINTPRTTLDLFGGLNYTRENYFALPGRNFAALTLGEEFMHKIGAGTALTQSFYIYPELTDNLTGQYHGTANFGTTTKLSKWLAWQNAFGDIYVSNPPEGKKQNDLLLTTGLNVSITH